MKKKIAVLILAFCTVLLLSSCGKTEEPTTTEPTTTAVTTTAVPVVTTVAPIETTAVVVSDVTTTVPITPSTTYPPETTAVATTGAPVSDPTSAVVQPVTEATTAAPVIQQDDSPEIFNGIRQFDFSKADPDPSKWTTEQIIKCYQSGMALEDHDGVQTDQSFELIGDLPGKAAILKQPVKLAMKLAAQPFGALPGGYWNIVPSDLKSADAHMEGDYVVINLYPQDQTDGPNGDEHEGTVGHVVNVVQGIDDFIAYVEENFSVLNAVYDDDSVVLKYSNAYAKDVKINTKTGKMESANWGYTIDIYLDHCSMAGVDFDNFHTTIGWKCWYPVVD